MQQYATVNKYKYIKYAKIQQFIKPIIIAKPYTLVIVITWFTGY